MARPRTWPGRCAASSWLRRVKLVISPVSRGSPAPARPSSIAAIARCTTPTLALQAARSSGTAWTKRVCLTSQCETKIASWVSAPGVVTCLNAACARLHAPPPGTVRKFPRLRMATGPRQGQQPPYVVNRDVNAVGVISHVGASRLVYDQVPDWADRFPRPPTALRQERQAEYLPELAWTTRPELHVRADIDS